MISKWAYILIGDNDTGKTTFQKNLIWHLCSQDRSVRLDTNLVFPITHRNAPRKLKTLFTINRSVQEKMGDYGSVDNYFNGYFRDADVVILSSHSHDPCINDIQIMIDELQKRYYNVNAVFFSNHLNIQTQAIAKLNWHEKLVINNPHSEEWEEQINTGAQIFGDMLIGKLSVY